jgi:hypothetical protein
MGCACDGETNDVLSDNEPSWTCIFAVANEIVETDIKENHPVYQALDNKSCVSKCPSTFREQFITKTCKSEILLNVNMFVNEDGWCSYCQDVNPYCLVCDTDNYALDNNLCLLCSVDNYLFLPNPSQNLLVNKCYAPDCSDWDPFNFECNKCAWIDWSPIIADLNDLNDDNDFTKVPVGDLGYLFNPQNFSQRLALTPYYAFLNPLNKMCTSDCGSEGMNLASPLSYYDPEQTGLFLMSYGDKGTLEFAPHQTGPFECICAPGFTPVFDSDLNLIECFDCREIDPDCSICTPLKC